MDELTTTYWKITLPDEWWHEIDEEAVVIGDPDDVGELTLSILETEGTVSVDDLLAMQEDDSPAEVTAVTVDEFPGFYRAYTDEEGSWREWVIACEQWIAYITYFCEAENKGLDDALIDEILSTLSFRSLDNINQEGES